MSKSKPGRLPPFVPLTKAVLDASAWRAMSHGARSLYVSLKRRYNHNFKNNGRIYLSQRQAVTETGSGFEEIVRWFLELQHYGFIVMTAPGYLGLEGKGRAPHWRLTEVSYMRGTSSKGMEDMPTMDFLRWDGSKFKRPLRWSRKTESRYGNAERSATEMLSAPATEMLSSNGNNRYGNAEPRERPSATEMLSISSLPLGRGGWALSEGVAPDHPSPDISHLISASGRRISESCFARTTSCRFEERPDADRV